MNRSLNEQSKQNGRKVNRGDDLEIERTDETEGGGRGGSKHENWTNDHIHILSLNKYGYLPRAELYVGAVLFHVRERPCERVS